MVVLSRFSDSMTAAQIPNGQWIARLQVIFTGKVLRNFQDLSDTDTLSFVTACEKLLASENF